MLLKLFILGGLFLSCKAPCPEGSWGPSCDKSCSETCKNRNCRPSGLCEECTDGFYSIRCNSRCPDNCLHAACFRYNVTCVHGCKNGSFGPKCTQKCSKGCLTGTCHRMTGACTTLSEHEKLMNVRVESCRDDVKKRCLDEMCDIGGSGEAICRHGCPERTRGLTCNMTCPDNCKSCDQLDISDSCNEYIDGHKGVSCAEGTTGKQVSFYPGFLDSIAFDIVIISMCVMVIVIVFVIIFCKQKQPEKTNSSKNITSMLKIFLQKTSVVLKEKEGVLWKITSQKTTPHEDAGALLKQQEADVQVSRGCPEAAVI